MLLRTLVLALTQEGSGLLSEQPLPPTGQDEDRPSRERFRLSRVSPTTAGYYRPRSRPSVSFSECPNRAEKRPLGLTATSAHRRLSDPLPNVYLHLDERSVVHTTYPLAACFPLQRALIRAGTCRLATYTSSGLQFTVAALAINEFSKIVATD